MSSQEHQRSVGFIQAEGQRWSCFLITTRTGMSTWRGHFTFRPCAPEGSPSGDTEIPVAGPGWLIPGGAEVRTADIFVEESEGEIDRKARAMGRPLLAGLLASALHVRRQAPGSLGEPIRELLTDRRDDPDDPRLASRYASYRLDQVAHLIALTDPADFETLVARVLEEVPVDFSTRDRTQLAMMVVERLEALLPLPPFEVWVLDYLADPAVYRLYAHRLHRQGILDD